MTINIKKRFGISVQQLRINMGLSQEKFALKISMDRSYFASVESGHRNISIENIKRIADGLEISLSDLFSVVDSYEEC